MFIDMCMYQAVYQAGTGPLRLLLGQPGPINCLGGELSVNMQTLLHIVNKIGRVLLSMRATLQPVWPWFNTPKTSASKRGKKEDFSISRLNGMHWVEQDIISSVYLKPSSNLVTDWWLKSRWHPLYLSLSLSLWHTLTFTKPQTQTFAASHCFALHCNSDGFLNVIDIVWSGYKHPVLDGHYCYSFHCDIVLHRSLTIQSIKNRLILHTWCTSYTIVGWHLAGMPSLWWSPGNHSKCFSKKLRQWSNVSLISLCIEISNFLCTEKSSPTVVANEAVLLTVIIPS